MIAVVGATSSETSSIKCNMKIDKKATDSLPFFYEGKLGNLDIVLVLSGIGEKNALNAVRVLTQLYKVDALLSVGVAGAVDPVLEVGDIVLGRQISSLNNEKKELASNTQLLDSAAEACKKSRRRYFIGSMITVPQMILSKEKKSEIYKNYGPLAVDMETYYIANEVDKLGIPFLSMRAISDNAKQSIKIDFEKIKSGTLQKGLYFLFHPFSYFRLCRLNKDIIEAVSNLPRIVINTLMKFEL